MDPGGVAWLRNDVPKPAGPDGPCLVESRALDSGVHAPGPSLLRGGVQERQRRRARHRAPGALARKAASAA